MSDKDIRLHPKLGLNVHMTICPRCGGDGQELLMLGISNLVVTCPHCGTTTLAARKGAACPKCKKSTRDGKSRELEEHERLPGSLCKKCEDEIQELNAEVARGGVHIRCKSCGMEGVIKAETPMAIEVRDHFGFHNGEPCGVEVDQCPKCENNHDGQARESDAVAGDESQVP